MNRRWLQVALAVVLVVAGAVAVIVLVLSFRDTVREVIAGPLSYLVYFIGLLLRSVPQALFLGLLVLVGIVIALSSVGSRRDEDGPPISSNRIEQRNSRLRTWTYYLSQIGRSAYAREKMALEMRTLALSSLALLEHTTPIDVERRIIDGSLDVPHEVSDIVLASRSRPGGGPRNWLARLIGDLRERISGRVISDATAALQSPAWARLEAALAYLEAQQNMDGKGKDS